METYIIVAVSAGPDSMSLLHKLQKSHSNIVVAHVNYHQRNTSMRDENTVRNYARKHELIFEKKDFNRENFANFQAEARTFRYEFFQELAQKYNTKTLYLGHHLDDDLETYLMQLNDNRDTDYPGIKEETVLFGLNAKRPLLKFTKEELINYCNTHKVPYEIDESNLELDYTRNKVRHEISQMSQETKDKWLRQLQEAKKEKEKYIASLPNLLNPFLIDDYKTTNQTKRIDALRIYLEKEGIEPYTFSKDYMMELDRQILNGQAQIDFEDRTLSVSHGEVMIHEDVSFSYTLTELKLFETKHFKLSSQGEVIEGITLQKEDFPITIRSAQKGDKIRLRYGTKSVHRFFIDNKIPIHKRKSWPVVENSMKDIVFVMGIGCDINHFSNNPSVFMLKL